MRRTTLTSTTAAIALAIGQTAPLPLAAQTAVGDMPTCSGESQLPCAVPGLDVVVENEVDRQTLAMCGQIETNGTQATEECSEAQVAEVVADLSPIGDASGATTQAQDVAEEASDMAEGTMRTAQAEVEEVEPEVNAEAEAQAAAEAEAAEQQAAEAEAEAQAAEQQAAEAEAQAAAEAEAQAEQQAAEEQAAQAEAEAAEAEAEAAEQEAAEAEAQAADEQAAEAEVQSDESEAGGQEQQEAEASAEAEAEAETDATASDTADQEVDELEQALEAEQSEAEATTEAEAEAETQDAPAEDTAETDTPADTADSETDELQQALEAEQAETEAEAESTANFGQSDQSTGAEAEAESTANFGQNGEATDVEAEEQTETTADLPEPQIDEDPEAQAQAQAEAAAQVEEQAAAAAAANEDAEAVSSEEVTLTEENTRSSDEEFETEVGGNAQTEANTETAPAAGTPRTSDDRDENLRDILTAAAAIGLGAYAIGQVTDDGGTVVANTGDRVVVENNGRYRIIKDDDALLRRPGSDVRVQTFEDGSTRSTVTAEDGTQTVTVRAADGRVLRRTQIYPNGDQVVLFDDTRQVEAVNVQQLRDTRAQEYEYANASEDELRTAILATRNAPDTRRYSLNQVRFVDAVRHQVPVIALDTVNFETGSAVIRPEEARDLSVLGNAMRDAIAEDPRQVFLIEGHTDTVGPASMNLALSDRRAESVALALTEYFDVPPANMIVQGYGESDLKVREAGDIRANRRAAVRNITSLLNES
ncbi:MULTISPECIES: OmpA family protein [unclassified Roseovarius]|uniref:OmpA family protein n=1 Tax=unclassified Roseovarius TaxID=2614913 RepID=UPI00273D20C4|nr:OmpA family protein [Roseovarius sp. MMSF_3350]